MKTRRLVRHSLRMMGRYKLRSSFMMLGSVLGVAALTFVISVGQAAQRKMLKTVRQVFGDSSVMIMDGGGHMMGGPRGPGTRLKVDDIAAIAKELPGIEAWDPLQVLSGASVRRGGVTDSARILGESERSEQVWGRTASRGAFFDETEVIGSARVAVIGETVANELFKNEDPLGADIEIGSVPFRVIGILEPWGTDPHGMDRDNEVVVPLSTLVRRLTRVDTISSAKLLVNDPAQAEPMTGEIKRVLRERHALAAGQADDFSILTATEVRRMVGEIQRVMFLYLPLIATVALLVGGIVSASLMLASVSERVAEIGLRRAMGARAQDIRLQFLLETTVTTLAGGVGGIVLGYFGAEMGASRMHLGSITPWTAALVGLIASTVVGLAAGLFPALKAAGLSPARALR
jgi:putative ABC transport system permease protein